MFFQLPSDCLNSLVLSLPAISFGVLSQGSSGESLRLVYPVCTVVFVMRLVSTKTE
jgi:hypothetical protein